MKYSVILFLIIFCSCGSDAPTPEGENAGKLSSAASIGKNGKQLHLTILLDLSDRIDPKMNTGHPSQQEKDSTLIGYLTDYFRKQMDTKGAYMAKGKMQVLLYPPPAMPGINEKVDELSVDLSKLNVSAKKSVYDSLQVKVASNISGIYNAVIDKASWPGSDIWRFFKQDVNYLAIDTDSSYRNLLVIFTDGYVYHQDSKERKGNRYSYILPELFDQYKLRNGSNWEENIQKLDYGLISNRSDLNNLEVLVLEINHTGKYKKDEEIVRKVLGKWFTEMNVKKWEVFNSDLPTTTKNKIDRFLME
jgi:hypothetical protein